MAEEKEAKKAKEDEGPKPMTKKEKRRAWLCATVGDVKGNAIADDEEKAGKVLYP